MMLTSLTKNQFDEVCYQYSAKRLRNSRNRSGRETSAKLLMILRKSLTPDVVAFFFGTKHPVVSVAMKTFEVILRSTFVSKYLGVDPINHMDRKDAVENHSIEFCTSV